MNENVSSDKLPFAEYAALEAERGARLYGKIGAPKLSFEELVASDLTFDEIEAEYGEETAINVGIAKDPEAPEWTEEDWARARPAIEVHPELVEWSLRRRGKQKAPTKELISIRLDSDITDHFRAGRPGSMIPCGRRCLVPDYFRADQALSPPS